MVEQFSTIVGKPANARETAPRITSSQKQIIDRPVGYSCSTVYEYLLEAFEKGGNRKAMGWRDIIEIHDEKKIIKKKVDGKDVEVEKVWNFYELSDYKYTTYDKLTELMHNIGRGLVKIGLKPSSEDKLHIYASTSRYWMQMFTGSQSQGIPVVTAYDTLGESGLTHSLVQTESVAIFTDNALLKTLINPLQKADNIKYIIYSEKLDPNDKRHGGKLYDEAKKALDKLKEVRPDIKFYYFNEIVKLGQNAKDEISPSPPKPEDISCIMYTSGTTGDPKGVTLTHSNLVAGCAGVSETVYGVVGKQDRVIAFLPLAHIFELAFELVTFYWGAILGYANVKTISSTSVRNCQGDMQTFKPTIMVGVAAVFEMIKKGIISQLGHVSKLKQKLFWMAYSSKLNGIPGSGILANIAFKKVKEATGGQLRFVLNGGSPISMDTQQFITTVICPLLIGYGLTETCANGCVLKPDHYRFGVTGDLAASVTIKLVDVEELNYFAKNNQGEIWIKGGCVLKEYYKNPKETADAITEDGWFKTGDIAEWTREGHLKIIDRKKNLVKTANGEYIALEKLESVYRSNKYVMNICVYADQNKVKPVGIIVPNLAPLAQLAKDLKILKANEDVESYLDNKKLRRAVLDDMLHTARSQGLNGIELLQGVVFFDGEWTPQNGYVTSAQKLKRKVILEVVQKQVDQIYSAN
ncbi:hypothetical protein Kpol_224p2 [Vanderwaltozyma polyspora DSM 70294]|uniref:AMP-dependent synthetase/ligase domain-containing protein n=1 Tax=Vanderwaltozyma polyspora (strain ATCC 22028 / DSM 70294 / BCRC 21397 / CBS 2163 / NBRC 10782 / NRRL Y-8283 / UCD 57-17) TaxID=436907 RepID=A7TTG2_VANPO|nr:uncharacterized protein Kpol_224p2 [Vanderwaltozyma polyspora DSM 70294]EDO14444.1 hypothetical protein Kpol_224p2 [Vanderwaltozyma polyspora DSM 70294]